MVLDIAVGEARLGKAFNLFATHVPRRNNILWNFRWFTFWDFFDIFFQFLLEARTATLWTWRKSLQVLFKGTFQEVFGDERNGKLLQNSFGAHFIGPMQAFVLATLFTWLINRVFRFPFLLSHCYLGFLFRTELHHIVFLHDCRHAPVQALFYSMIRLGQSCLR